MSNDKFQLHVGIQKTDQVIMNYIKYVMKPTVYEYDGSLLQVPVVYNGAQRWVQVRQRSYLVDTNNNPLYPVISFSRTNTKTTGELLNINTGGHVIQMQNRYSKDRPYSEIDKVPYKRKYINIGFPRNMQFQYQFQMFTNNHEHMNQLIQLFLLHHRKWWIYDDHRVFIKASDYSNTTQIQAGSQRLIKSTFSMQARATLLQRQDIRQQQPTTKIDTDITI